MMPPTLTVGPLTLHLYGLILGIAMWVGVEVAAKVGKRHGINEHEVWAVAVWALGVGVVGARFYHVIDQWGYYQNHITQIVMVWRGGLGIWGGILGGFFGLIIGAKLKNRQPGPLMDCGAFGVPVGQAIGRWGNFVNQELYGEGRQPLFLYESVAMLGVFLLLWKTERQGWLPWGKGAYVALYFLSYAVIRFGLEGLRQDPWMAAGVPVARWVALGVMAGSVGWLWRVYARR